MAASTSRLFQPLKLTPHITLGHRLAMAPLTRFRSSDEHVPIVPLMATHYAQRAASLPGTLLVSEGTFISPSAGGYGNIPGIWNDAQVAAWTQITDAVHAKGGFIFCQLWALGRAANPVVAAQEGFTVHSSSAVAMHEGKVVPHEMSVAEIKQRVAEYAAAARNAIRAGFDGVEIHAANGYLIDQFTQDTCNRRTDEYGGSVENRSRFVVEVVDAVVQAVGAERTGIRLSPWSTWQAMRMGDPVQQFEDVIRKISGRGLAYLHLVRALRNGTALDPDHETLDFAVRLWDGPVLIAGDLTPRSARHLVDEEYEGKDVVATFGRYFISTPDLPFRIREGIALSDWNEATFYLRKSPVGYIDQPFSKEFESLHGSQALN
ncbi:hypothetical protein C8A03DRAFT_36732 [Achaetomium macrosporum]|uniref:NADH:flavin oxidoreductase/NADH oxidase N-terminal domain-containing protein n=1 Tax=Achaetomium macrosporum TaxID=79813 RepID=A0AAN7C623_9PEZI|nr:hypothetical protein C8A03DRAFT_36732 [Achaetomium macrosporum]